MPTLEKKHGSDVLVTDQKITLGDFFRVLGGGLVTLGGAALSPEDAWARQTANRKPAGKEKKKAPQVFKGVFGNTFIEQYSDSNYEKMDNLKPMGKWLGKDWTLAFLNAYYVNTAGKGHLAGFTDVKKIKIELKDYGRGSKKMIDHEIIEYQAPDYQANSLQ